MRIVLPYPPTVNTYYTVARGRKILSKRGREFKKAAAVMAQHSYRIKTMCGPLAVSIDLTPPDRRRRDIDNTIKPVLDALTESRVWLDDSQIKELSVSMGQPMNGGECVVTVEPIIGMAT